MVADRSRSGDQSRENRKRAVLKQLERDAASWRGGFKLTPLSTIISDSNIENSGDLYSGEFYNELTEAASVDIATRKQ